jgi:hypothetical protein
MSEDHSTEVWREIPDMDGRYFASNLGRIRGPRRVLKPFSADGRYLSVSVRKSYDVPLKKRFLVHRLVAAAFHGPCPFGLEVNHKNGIKNDNSSDNLEYVTKGENERHAHKIGLKTHRGECNPTAKLTVQEILECRRLAGTISQHNLAKRFGVSQASISLIINRKHWGHVE